MSEPTLNFEELDAARSQVENETKAWLKQVRADAKRLKSPASKARVKELKMYEKGIHVAFFMMRRALEVKS